MRLSAASYDYCWPDREESLAEALSSRSFCSRLGVLAPVTTSIVLHRKEFMVAGPRPETENSRHTKVPTYSHLPHSISDNNVYAPAAKSKTRPQKIKDGMSHMQTTQGQGLDALRALQSP